MAVSYDFEKIKNIAFGADYSKKQTTFTLFSLNAEKAEVVLVFPLREQSFPMEKNGAVFSATVEVDLENVNYYYRLTFKDRVVTSNDPFGKGTSLNSQYSTVVNDKKIQKKHKIKMAPCPDPVLYEVNVRDFTEEAKSVKNKGKFLGMVEPHRKTEQGNPLGLDYLKKLGITHVQLQPVMDYYGSDTDPYFYNWGYDPLSYFALEGRYSVHPENPSCRLGEFRKMVDTFHHHNIRVVLDVVYNHVYRYEDSSLEKTCPHFYFRRYKNGKIANGSYCGNEIRSEEPFVRKMILDSIRYYLDTFDVDGFRFDLMGLMDLETIKEIYIEASKIKKDVLLYGEGWVMGEILPHDDRADLDHTEQLRPIGFFNDFYRDILKGKNLTDNRGFIGGDTNYIHGLEQAIFGSTLRLSYEPMFLNWHQSVNYVECHDNETLYDRLAALKIPEDELKERINLANGITLLSFGTPFIHMGQEIGLSKNGYDNTYNRAKINNMNWKTVDERMDMVHYLSSLIALRKWLRLYEYTDLNTLYEEGRITKTEDNVLILDLSRDNKTVTFFINGNENSYYHNFDTYKQAILLKAGYSQKMKMKGKNVIIPPLTISAFTDE